MYKHYIKVNGKDANNNDIIVQSFTTGFQEPEETDICILDYSSQRHFNLSLPMSYNGTEIVEYVKPLADYKVDALNRYSVLSFTLRQSVCADYKLINSGLGVYEPTETTKIKTLIDDIRTEFYRIKTIIDNATDSSTIDSIVENFTAITGAY